MSKKKTTIEELLEVALLPNEEQPYEEVPDNWIWIKLGSVITLISGRDINTKLCNSEGVGIPYIMGASNILDNELIIERWIETPTVIGCRGDVLISVKGTVGKTIIQELEEVHLSRQIMALRCKDKVFNKFLYFYMQTYIDKLKEAAKGIIPGISRDDILNAPFPLLPLNEQKRIVNKVELLLNKIEEAKRLIEETLKQVKIEKKTVIYNGYMGNVTETWRKDNHNNDTAKKLLQNIQKERKDTKSSEDFVCFTDNTLPENWCITRIEDIAECLDKLRKPVSKKDRHEGEIPYYGANGQVDCVDDYIFDEDLVLVVEDETFTGREKPFSYCIKGKSWVNNHAHVLRPLGGITVEYLNICLSYYDFIPLTSGSTGRRKLTQAALKGAELRIAPLSEQRVIVDKVERIIADLNETELCCIDALKYIESIKNSILHKAFRGELGTNDPTEENAIELLKEVLQGQVN